METSIHLEALASRIAEGNCILVLGPGASTDSSGDQEVPIHQKFARQLAGSLSREQRKDLNQDDLRHVSQVWQEKNRNSALLQLEFEKFYKKFSAQTTDFHRSIAALPFRLCITTTPDDFLFNAMVEAKKKPVRDFYNFKKKERVIRRLELSAKCPLIYHLYGHLDDRSSLVITEDDLIDFLTNIVSKAPPLPEQIMGILSHPDSTCLFVDLGFKNWYLRVLIRSLSLLGHRERSVALEPAEFFAQSKQHQTMVYFSATNTMEFHQDSLNEFAARLRAAYESIASPGELTVEPPPGAPTAFLSYASEDAILVEQLAQKLKNGGVAVWRDKQNLRAGDNWERIITQVIEKQVDYFVAVQGSGMARVRGVFYEEIQEALKQQKRTREGIRFLIPVHSGDNNRLPELSQLHSISIDTDEGVNNLIRSILEDWNLRTLRPEISIMNAAAS